MLLSSVFKILSSCVIKTHDVLSCKWVAKEWLCRSNWKSNMSVKSAWTHWLHFISCVRVGMKPGMRVTAASKTLKLLWMSNIEHGKKTLLMQHHSRAARLSAKKKKKKIVFFYFAHDCLSFTEENRWTTADVLLYYINWRSSPNIIFPYLLLATLLTSCPKNLQH